MYRHCKENAYTVLGVAHHSENQDELVAFFMSVKKLTALASSRKRSIFETSHKKSEKAVQYGYFNSAPADLKTVIDTFEHEDV